MKREPALNRELVWLANSLLAGAMCWACGGAPQARFSRADELLARVREQSSCSRAVSGEARLRFSGEGRRLSGKLMYLAAAPAKLRFDVYSSFGVTLSTLCSDGEQFSLFNLEEKVFLRGPALTCNVERFTRVPVPALALVELLRGRPPVLVHAPDAVRLSASSSLLGSFHYELELEGQYSARQLLKFEVHPQDWSLPTSQQRLRLSSVEVWQGGESSYQAELEAYRLGLEPQLSEPDSLGPATRCQAEIPGRLALAVARSGHRLELENLEVVQNPHLEDEQFVQQIPGGVSLRTATCSEP